MKLVLASGNAGKLAELSTLFASLGIELVSQAALGVASPDEPYHTFVENALHKARHAAQHTGLCALADDAGLCVEAFGGLPGVQTAFYAQHLGYPKGEGNNVRALLDQMKDVSDRRATLVSTLVAVRNPQDPQPLIAMGYVKGEITREPIGDNGFGFDPVMLLPTLGQTFAQLSPEDKNRLSHRGRAAQQMQVLMREHWL